MARADPRLTTATHLSRAQFDDHIPAILEAYLDLLAAGTGDDKSVIKVQAREDTDDHGLQRWQQGYELHQLTREWGHLHLVLLEELEDFVRQHDRLPPEMMPRARRLLATLCADGVSRSAERYWRLHQTEAAGQVRDLEDALARMTHVERERAAAWRGAAHDVRGGFGAVEMASELLKESESAVEQRENVELLQHNVSALREMLNELLDLARLEAGHEGIDVTTFDVGQTLQSLGDGLQPSARTRGLSLRCSGPAALVVEGDRRKITRIVQNLVLNAIKYTEQGGVTVTWCDDPQDDRWSVRVIDTGPGIARSSGAGIRSVLHEATAIAGGAGHDGEKETNTPPAATGAPINHLPTAPAHGEGIGLSIVKRLCELLDAVVELESEPGRGSAFRVRFPRRYPERPDRGDRSPPAGGEASARL